MAATLELAPAIDAMNAAMGITGEGALPNQVAKLMVATGMAAAAPVAAPAGLRLLSLAAPAAPARAPMAVPVAVPVPPWLLLRPSRR